MALDWVSIKAFGDNKTRIQFTLLQNLEEKMNKALIAVLQVFCNQSINQLQMRLLKRVLLLLMLLSDKNIVKKPK